MASQDYLCAANETAPRIAGIRSELCFCDSLPYHNVLQLQPCYFFQQDPVGNRLQWFANAAYHTSTFLCLNAGMPQAGQVTLINRQPLMNGADL